MTTYRTVVSDQLGHWGVTIVREGLPSHTWKPSDTDDAVCAEVVCGFEEPEHPELVAVVVNGDQALAERICALLNDVYTPDVDHTRGAADALALVRWMLDDRACSVPVNHHIARQVLATAARQLGVDGDAPSAPAISPQAAQDTSGVVGSGSGDPNALETAFPARYWGERPAHPTCIDITTIDQRPGSAWMCGPACPKPCICNDPPPTVDKPKNGTASRPPGWACPRHGTVI